ncbi:MAG: cation-translocating P-type ATPase, partial [Candidatus Hodarchaeales archaeon]
EKNYAISALRVLAFAFRTITKDMFNSFKNDKSPDFSIIESNLIFLGLMAMRDPPRPEAIEAIKVARQAGIRVIMITGDHSHTAVAIGEKMGLITPSEKKAVLTGYDLVNIEDIILQEKVKNTKIFARVSPEHKLQIVNALQSNGEIVAMTGDGVNDAPALKQADIGVAMGIAGTDVAKQASDMILTDDNFASLEIAVEEGRGIYSNMKKFIGYLLACNAGEIVTIFLGIIILSLLTHNQGQNNLSLEELVPLTALQLLYVNLVTDGLPALALGVDPKDPHAMNYPPRDPNEKIFNLHMTSSILLAGTVVGIGTLFLFFMELDITTGANHAYAQTIAFTVLIFFQKFMALSSRSETESLFTVGVFANKYLWGAILLTIFLHIGVVYYGPLQDVFGTVALDLVDWIIIILMASTVFIAEEIRKFLFRRNGLNLA